MDFGKEIFRPELIMKYLTKVFSRNNLMVVRGQKLTCNTIVLPQYFIRQTHNLCEREFEVAGWLVCRKQISGIVILYVVEYIFMTDEGGGGSVYPTKRLSLSDDFCAIEFHVHPKYLGEYWWNKFSDVSLGANNDYATMTKRLNNDETYKHVLFTPTHVLTFGNEKPDFRYGFLDDDARIEVIQKEQYWRNKLR